MWTAILVALAAIVVEDQTALRAVARDQSPRQVELSKGDWLEVRGERAGYLQVYDHRHERSGYVRVWQVRSYPLDESSAPTLLAIVGFLKDQPGSESLGIGHAALFLRVAPRAANRSEIFDALGTMADRLARRASGQRTGITARDAPLAAHLAVAQSYGVAFHSIERGERTLLCYDGDAFRHVLASTSAPQARAAAALALTRRDCLPANAGPVETRRWNEWRLEILGRIDAPAETAPSTSRLRLRHAEVLAWLSYDLASRGEISASAERADAAIKALALVDQSQLSEEDRSLYEDTAVRVAATRWASETPGAQPRKAALTLELAKGQPGETCLRLYAGPHAPDAAPLVERCSYGFVWQSSIRVSPRGDALAVAVQPMPSWTELWIFRRAQGSWQVDALTPAPSDPDAGYVESAGFSPDGAHLCLVREAMVKAQLKRSFEIRKTATLTLERSASTLAQFPTFRRWSAPDWHSRTLALRDHSPAKP